MVEREELIKLWATSAYLLYNSCLVGDPAPYVARLVDRMAHPQPGDWVLEISSFRNRDWSERIGKLQEIKEEPAFLDYDEELNGEPCPLDTFWYIEDVNGIQRRWCNCRFITVFENLDFMLDDYRRAFGSV